MVPSTGDLTLPTQNAIKVGAILPLTGDVSIVGTSIEQGIGIAKDEINQTGGINGRKLEVIVEDDHYDNAASVTAANKLLSVDKIDAGIIALVHGAKSVKPVFEKARVPLVVAWDSTREIESGDYVFSTGFSTERAGIEMADFAFLRLDARKTAIVLHQDEWSEIIGPAFQKEFEQRGGSVALIERVAVGELDFRTILSKIRDQHVDSVYFPLVPVGSDVFMKQAHELDLNVMLLSGDALIPDIIAAASPAAEGVYFTNISAEDNPISQKLLGKYRTKFGKDPVALPMVAFGYDAMMAVATAAQKTPNATPEQIKDALYSVDFVGAGGRIQINPSGLSDRVENVYRIANGEPVRVE
ncbi:MAG: penicillin-binding protein activator [Candidatus Diapherotrites archaeon]|nr:penicillin-binding protein activator [Candidatus Diapherotrites archaeon]